MQRRQFRGAAQHPSFRKLGSWSTARVRDLCDQMVYRRDPDAVRERRDEAMKGRCFFTEAGLDGMATVGATMSAERAAIVARVVECLAAQVCRHDSRTKTARASDALFALVEHAPFGCDCARPECTFTVVDADEVAANAARIVIHVVTDTTTLTGSVPADANDTAEAAADPAAHARTQGADTTVAAADQAVAEVALDEVAVDVAAAEESAAEAVAAESVSTDEVPAEDASVDAVAVEAAEAAAAEPELVDGVGYIAGLGIVSGAHIRDLAADPAAIIRPLGDGTDTPSRPPNRPTPTDPQRRWTPIIRARDQYCTWPGCTRPAWDGDLDHITEYDHAHPERGGQTSATGLGAKCRFHHLLKTFGDFVDDQYPDPDNPGRIIRTVTIPEGRTVLGPAYTGHDTHPGLDMIVFGDPPGAGKKTPPTPRTSTPGEPEPTRPAPRTEQK
ncbi:HNH endonuclease signature motif containing protein, partial [Rhodococcoides kroppenstedtii]|uniref:HNH endonuclease signature motif containing protein n=2 Tax=Mycobacteriales TaxID=85007 RepID=UPI001C9B80A1